MKSKYQNFLLKFFSKGLLFGCLFGASAWAAKDIHVEALKKRLAFIFKSEELKKTKLSVMVYSLSRQEELFSLDADKSLSPASTIKLLTAYVALKKLGTNFRFKTQFLSNGVIRDGVLQGDLIVRGGGDPTLDSKEIFSLVQELKRFGLNKINGNILVDDTVFDEIIYDPDRIENRSDRPYDAPVGGLNFNYNTAKIFIRGESQKKPKVEFEPDAHYFEIENTATVKENVSDNKILIKRVFKNNKDTILVSGYIGNKAPEMQFYVNVSQPALYAGWAIRYYLQQMGINTENTKVNVFQKQENTSKNLIQLSNYFSEPLREIVIKMNKESNNFIAETLVKAIGKEIRNGQGTNEKGISVLREEATRMGMNTSGFDLYSGSGLTRKNRSTARQFNELLIFTFNDMDVLPELLTSLPIAGIDGTLKNRFIETSAYGRLRAKTGTIDGVSTLVGMVQAKGKEWIAFSVLMSDYLQSSKELRTWQNYFGQALADFQRKNNLNEVQNSEN